MDNIRTFKDLYLFLQSHNSLSIIPWLKISWQGKDKQESLLRLFASLGLIKIIQEYSICKGNFNLTNISLIKSYRDIIYADNKEIYLKDSGDSSDLTGISKINNKNILATT